MLANTAFDWLLLAGVVAVLVLQVILLLRSRQGRAAEELKRALHDEIADSSRAGRAELAENLMRMQQALGTQVANIAKLQNDQLAKLTETNERKLTEVRATLEAKLKDLQTDNAAKLEEMRRTVDEKLQQTLEKRLGESFKLVSERLEAVHKGLGEMQTLATGVGDLKKVLTNVKTRGTWGEVQLENLLEQMLTPEQYAKNVATRPGSSERVEFAIRFPGADSDKPMWLPIDAKFPREDYERLLEAQDRADIIGVETAGKSLEIRIRNEAKAIREKYLEPPHTTDFGLLFLPTEGLYAEVLRRPGLADTLQRECRVTIAGPTTLAALLNSLQMGFRTLAIGKRSSEVWQLLSVVKSEFGKFGDLLARAKKQLETANNTLGEVESKTRSLGQKLRKVELLGETPSTPPLLDEPSDDTEQ